MSEPNPFRVVVDRLARQLSATPAERERFEVAAREIGAGAIGEAAQLEQLARPYLTPQADSTPRFDRGVLERALAAVSAAPYEPDPVHRVMTEHLNRLAAAYHPGGRYPCPVGGCTWVLDVPPPELVDMPGRVSTRNRFRSEWRYVGAPVEQVEYALALHADMHASNGVPPLGVEPLIVEPGEPDGWRVP